MYKGKTVLSQFFDPLGKFLVLNNAYILDSVKAYE